MARPTARTRTRKTPWMSETSVSLRQKPCRRFFPSSFLQRNRTSNTVIFNANAGVYLEANIYILVYTVSPCSHTSVYVRNSYVRGVRFTCENVWPHARRCKAPYACAYVCTMHPSMGVGDTAVHPHAFAPFSPAVGGVWSMRVDVWRVRTNGRKDGWVDG